SLRVCKNGIEFRSHTPMEEWTELTLEVLSPRDGHREQTTGVVVACRGNSATGYAISVVLMGLTPQSAQLLQRAGFSPLA
ncbi:MAG: hypothetical protein HY300_00645, partial [Verrucomicrobia bacterium]|nr:hypothetical protein [Verrucomicrobiota bacterium]